MPTTLCKLLCLARIGGGMPQTIKLDPADQGTDILQALDTDLVALQRLPRRLLVCHAGPTPSYGECRDAIVAILQNVGNGTYDLPTAPVKTGHIFSGGVWTASQGFAFQLLESSSAKSKNLPAKNATNASTSIVLDYLVQVSF